MNRYFLLDTRLNGTYIYIITDSQNAGVMIDRVTHVYNEDFNNLMAILIKEKEIYKIKILTSPFNDFVISQLMSFNNLEIEVIEKI